MGRSFETVSCTRSLSQLLRDCNLPEQPTELLGDSVTQPLRAPARQPRLHSAFNFGFFGSRFFLLQAPKLLLQFTAFFGADDNLLRAGSVRFGLYVDAGGVPAILGRERPL